MAKTKKKKKPKQLISNNSYIKEITKEYEKNIESQMDYIESATKIITEYYASIKEDEAIIEDPNTDFTTRLVKMSLKELSTMLISMYTKIKKNGITNLNTMNDSYKDFKKNRDTLTIQELKEMMEKNNEFYTSLDAHNEKTIRETTEYIKKAAKQIQSHVEQEFNEIREKVTKEVNGEEIDCDEDLMDI